MKEKDMVTQLRLEPVSENMAQYIRTRKLAVRLKICSKQRKMAAAKVVLYCRASEHQLGGG
jgi:hypothetical protein